MAAIDSDAPPAAEMTRRRRSNSSAVTRREGLRRREDAAVAAAAAAWSSATDWRSAPLLGEGGSLSWVRRAGPGLRAGGDGEGRRKGQQSRSGTRCLPCALPMQRAQRYWPPVTVRGERRMRAEQEGGREGGMDAIH